MGISRDSRHKKRATGGRMPVHKKKRQYEMGRQAAMTKIGNQSRIQILRTRGGNQKFRALRLAHGNFSWASEQVAKKCKILDVVYNASNNELVRTKTLVKNAIVEIDAGPFRAWFLQHYGIELSKKKQEEQQQQQEPKKQSGNLKSKIAYRNKDRVFDQKVLDRISTGRVYACISSRPGQVGRADGYILEGNELEFYNKKMIQKKK